jgi:DNA-directed RNA polymerase
MIDLRNRPNQKDKIVTEFKEEFSISSIVKAGMRDYTKQIEQYLQEDTNIVAKKVLEAMFMGDESTLALIALRTILSCLIRQDDGTMLLSSLSKVINKSILHSKSLEQLEAQHASLNAYINTMYKRDESRKIRAKLRSHLKLVGETQEKFFLDEYTSAESIGSLLIYLLIESFDLIEVVKLDKSCSFEGKRYTKHKPLSYIVRFSEDTKYMLENLNYIAEDMMKPTVMPVTDKPEKVTKWYDIRYTLKHHGRPPNLIKMPKRKQNLREFRYVMDKYLDVSKFNDIHHAIESTEWCINTEVYEVMRHIFDNNIEDTSKVMYKNEHYNFHPVLVGELPRRYGLEPDSMIIKSKLGRTYIDEKRNKEWFHNDEKIGINRFNNIKNDLLAFNEKNLNKALSLMSMFKVCEEFKDTTFYFTYQYDTRFRIYPIQNILNPQSDTKGKALLMMVTDAEPLTEQGRKWAKIHGANVLGYDKASLEERIEAIEDVIRKGHLDRIVEDPIKHLELWCHADSPYEYLAFCLEYHKTLLDSSHAYRLPVSLDATCSGIQMYSGLLRDLEGAKAVNVVGKTRQDIYGQVAKVSNRLLKTHKYTRYGEYVSNSGNKHTIDFRPIADSLVGRIDRSITKRNTMTQPYSVTLRGMQNQLKETFNEMEEQSDKWWVGENWQVSKLLAEVNQKAIDEVVISATKGKEFIKKITGIIAKKNKGLLYTAKFGGVIYQKNLKTKPDTIWAHIWTPERGTERIRFSVQEKAKRVNVSAQKSASAPNFIHSLDTTQLHLCVKGCVQRGIKGFWLVHDDYRVQANKVDIMNEEVREAYISLFKGDVLYDWAIEVLTNASFTFEEIGKIFSEMDDPMVNTLELDDVRNAPYFFS